MRVITNRRLLEFSAIHQDAGGPLQAWRKTMESTNFGGFAELREVFRSVDKVGDLHVFNIAGNKYRLIAHSTRFGHRFHGDSATCSTSIRPGQSERSDARFSG